MFLWKELKVVIKKNHQFVEPTDSNNLIISNQNKICLLVFSIFQKDIYENFKKYFLFVYIKAYTLILFT